MDDLEQLKRILRNFSYVNPTWEKMIYEFPILIFEVASTNRELDKQIECTSNDLTELILYLKRLVQFFDEIDEYEKAIVYLYDMQIFCIEKL